MSHLKESSTLNQNCYRITRFIAQGGFGITYLAEEIGYFKMTGYKDVRYIAQRVPETVVVKELFYSDYSQRDDTTGLLFISNTQRRTEFEKLVNKQVEEGEILRSLDHPNIIRTRDVFKENNTAYIVIDFIDGVDLKGLLEKSGKLNVSKALHYIQQILDAAKYIHSKKILHLDISPSNILVKKDTDQAILIDFGASLAYNDENKVQDTTSRLVTGMKRNFAPNEQADIFNLKNFDASFDTYAIGATLYNLLTGELPPPSSFISTGREKIIPPSTFNSEVNEYLDAVILKAMAPKFHDRFSTSEAFERMLSREGDFFKALRGINDLVLSDRYSEALAEINKVTGEFLETRTLSKLNLLCREEMNKKEKEEQYQKFISRGDNWFNRKEYALAKTEFEEASRMFPGKTDTNDRIRLCDQKIAEEELERKISDLLSRMKQLDREGSGEEARSIAMKVLELSPADQQALQFIRDRERDQKDQLKAIKEKAATLFDNEQFDEAALLYRQVKEKNPGDFETENRLLLISKESGNYRNVQDKYRRLETGLNKAKPSSSQALTDLRAIEKEFKNIESARRDLQLPHRTIDKIAANVKSRLYELIDNAEKTKVISETEVKTLPDPQPEPLPDPVPKKFSNKKRIYLIGGAGVLVIILIIMLTGIGGSKNATGQGGQDTASKPITHPETKPVKPEPYYLTSEDLSKIDAFLLVKNNTTSCDDDMRGMHDKIQKASLAQQNLKNVEEFELFYLMICK